MDKVKKLLQEYGYEENEIELIIENERVKKYKSETLLNKIRENYNYLLSLGYSREEVIKMTKTLPSIYGYSIENLKKKIEDLEKLGYSKEEVIKITKSMPSIYGFSIENIKQKIEDLEKLGYSREEVIKITKSMPTIYGLSIENIKQKIEDLEKLGYSKEEVIKMTKTLPSIYGYSIENLNKKIEDLEKLGYSREEVIKMTKTLPSIYGYSIENIREKIEFYDSIGLHLLAVEDTKKLMQSTALSYARYMFLKEKGIEINETNYRKLFDSEKRFVKQYGVTKQEILAKYNYEESMKNKSVQKLGVETQVEQENVELLDKIEGRLREGEKNLTQQRGKNK